MLYELFEITLKSRIGELVTIFEDLRAREAASEDDVQKVRRSD